MSTPSTPTQADLDASFRNAMGAARTKAMRDWFRIESGLRARIKLGAVQVAGIVGFYLKGNTPVCVLP